MKRCTMLLTAGLAVLSFSSAPVWAQANPDAQQKAQVSRFLNEASIGNQQEIAEGQQAIAEAGKDLPLKSFGSMLKADHRVNQEAVEALASREDISLNSTAKTPKPAENLLHMTGERFAAAFAADEIKDHQRTIKQFQTAEQNFQDNPPVEMYIKQSLPVLQTHLKEAQILQRHLQQKEKQQQSEKE